MNKERANEIMKELKENCKKNTMCKDCVFFTNDIKQNSSCILQNNAPEEYETDILDEKEKEYLSNVIKPFRNKVKHISKTGAGDEYITISLDTETIDFPYFKRNTMYKGMERNKEYTLEELGI